MKRTIPALLLAVALGGCASVTTEDYNLPVRIGMTERQVKDALGKPDLVTQRPDGSQVWVYSFDIGVDAKSATYVLKDGKVVEVPPAPAHS
jgi:outer membrane protein assembly factor BamE (lipoprotein component of BamABCDE complex)